MSGFAGFDASGYPGTARMAELKRTTNLVWCGFYLGPAPSHSDAGWMAHRAELAAQNWGFAPIYVGQQVMGPGRHVVTAAQGEADGVDAVELMRKAGFATGSCVYLDLENGPPFQTAQREYVSSWVDAVGKAGFAAGIYCSFLFAVEVADLFPRARIWAFHVRTVSRHPVAGPNYPNPDPSTSGFAGAVIWQHGDSCVIDGQLLVDLDSANSPDPSAPAVAPPPVATGQELASGLDPEIAALQAKVAAVPPDHPTFWQELRAMLEMLHS